MFLRVRRIDAKHYCLSVSKIVVGKMMLYTSILIALLVVFLLSKKRYRWFYILYKTLPRDLKAGVRFTMVSVTLWQWQMRNMTVAKIFTKIAKKTPNKVALYFEDDAWTFQQMDDYSNKIGAYFKSKGYKKGDTIALLLESRPEYVCLWLGLCKIGVTTALINTNLTGEPLVHSISVAKSSGVIFGTQFTKVVSDVKTKLPTKLFQFHEDVLSQDGVHPDTINLRAELLKIVPKPLPEVACGSVKDKVLYIYTSGTTGLPKAAVITNMRFLFMAAGVYFMTAVKQSDIIYDPLPLYHSAGGMVGVGQSVLHGVTVAIRKKFSASNYWKDCIKYKCTTAQYIGELCRYLLSVPPSPVDSQHSVRVMVGNGLKAQIWQQFADRFHVEQIYEFYGATEGNSNLVNIDNTPGSVGFVPRYTGGVYPVTLIRCDEQTGTPIRNEAGRCTRCGPGEPGVFVGKIYAKAAINQFSGYADKKATEKKILENVFKEGDMYFNSGDILVQDEFGYYYFKDRTGDTFRWKGENVATTEVEAVISNVVNLNDAVVYGVEIPNTDGKAGMAAIVDTDKNLNMSKLAKGLKSSLPVYAIPLFVRVMESLPLTGTFKLKKVDLQQDAYDISKVKDDIYFYDSKNVTYVKLTKDLHDDIMTGKVRV